MNIDRYVGKVKKCRIYRIGIELEGGWERSKLAEGVRVEHDGSVHIYQAGQSSQPVAGSGLSANYREALAREATRQANISGSSAVTLYEQLLRQVQQQSNDPQFTITNGVISPVAPPAPRPAQPNQSTLEVGEITSQPMELAKWTTWMKQYYPQVVNETCGLHVHMSFNSALNYSRLIVPEYQICVVDHLTKWAKEESLSKGHPIWPRLAGENEYCQHKFYGETQITKREKVYDRKHPGHRYTAISYPYLQHTTVECRLLPMMETVEQSIKAVQRVLDVTNAFLVATAKKEAKMRVDVEDNVKDVFREDKVIHI